jgi:hypothetical protein
MSSSGNSASVNEGQLFHVKRRTVFDGFGSLQ